MPTLGTSDFFFFFSVVLIYHKQYVTAPPFSLTGQLPTVNLYYQYSSIWLHENFIAPSPRLKVAAEEFRLSVPGCFCFFQGASAVHLFSGTLTHNRGFAPLIFPGDRGDSGAIPPASGPGRWNDSPWRHAGGCGGYCSVGEPATQAGAGLLLPVIWLNQYELHLHQPSTGAPIYAKISSCVCHSIASVEIQTVLWAYQIVCRNLHCYILFI